MFDLGATELLLIVVVAVIVIGPKDMPLALRTAGQWMGKVRRLSNHFRSGLDAMIREAEMEDMEKKWREQNERIKREHRADSPPEAEPTGALPAPPPPDAALRQGEAEPAAGSLAGPLAEPGPSTDGGWSEAPAGAESEARKAAGFETGAARTMHAPRSETDAPFQPASAEAGAGGAEAHTERRDEAGAAVGDAAVAGESQHR